MIAEMPRERTLNWEDPAPYAAAAREMTGLEFLRAIGRGDLPVPPMLRTLGIEPVEVDSGKAVFSVRPGAHHSNPLGIAHGGLAAALCDTAMGCAVHTLLPVGTAYTTLELKINFVRPLTGTTGEVVAEGRTVHVGSRVATAEARVTDGRGRLYAHATTTCMILGSSSG